MKYTLVCKRLLDFFYDLITVNKVEIIQIEQEKNDVLLLACTY